MRKIDQNGISLIELLVIISIMGIIAGAAIPLLSTSLDAHSRGMARSRLYHEGLLVMESMTSSVRHCTFLLIPNNHTPTRDILSFSGTVNEDDDYYFNDPLFPKIDEDPSEEMTRDEIEGILGVDDDGDGLVDETFGEHGDDDEDGQAEEDPLDGLDNDGDGNIDEDCTHDSNNDNEPGIALMDDNADGQVDIGGSISDDDEDGSINEDWLNPVIYTFESATSTLTESFPGAGESRALSNNVTDFRVDYILPERIRIQLELTGDDGETVIFSEYVCPRNTRQKTGKRVQ